MLLLAPDVGGCYGAYFDELIPLANFETLPDSLLALPLSNGDIALFGTDGQEAVFDVVGVVLALSLETPPNYAK